MRFRGAVSGVALRLTRLGGKAPSRGAGELQGGESQIVDCKLQI